MIEKLYILDNEDGSVSVVENQMEGDMVLCNIELSENSRKTYEALEVLRIAFGGESPFPELFDEIANAVYSVKK